MDSALSSNPLFCDRFDEIIESIILIRINQLRRYGRIFIESLPYSKKAGFKLNRVIPSIVEAMPRVILG
jgi:hypothetical protein